MSILSTLLFLGFFFRSQIPASLPGSPLHMQPDSINDKVNHAVNDSSAESDQTNIELNVESEQENVDEAVREYSSTESMQQHVEDDVRVDASADPEEKHSNYWHVVCLLVLITRTTITKCDVNSRRSGQWHG